jgi:DNA-binding GntR family transcriptional regulator
LVEAEIADKLAVSRTPVREALKRLGLAGYADNLVSRGLVVTEHTTRQVQSLWELREALETAAIKLSCQHITKEQIQEAEKYYMLSIEAIRNGDIDRYIELHNAFHSTLYAPCGNEQMLSLIRTLRFHYFNRRLARIYTPREWQTQIQQHGRILEAMRKRNARQAETALRRHLRIFLKIALRRL